MPRTGTRCWHWQSLTGSVFLILGHAYLLRGIETQFHLIWAAAVSVTGSDMTARATVLICDSYISAWCMECLNDQCLLGIGHKWLDSTAQGWLKLIECEAPVCLHVCFPGCMFPASERQNNAVPCVPPTSDHCSAVAMATVPSLGTTGWRSCSGSASYFFFQWICEHSPASSPRSPPHHPSLSLPLSVSPFFV